MLFQHSVMALEVQPVGFARLGKQIGYHDEWSTRAPKGRCHLGNQNGRNQRGQQASRTNDDDVCFLERLEHLGQRSHVWRNQSHAVHPPPLAFSAEFAFTKNLGPILELRHQQRTIESGGQHLTPHSQHLIHVLNRVLERATLF